MNTGFVLISEAPLTAVTSHPLFIRSRLPPDFSFSNKERCMSEQQHMQEENILIVPQNNLYFVL
jgi:hypothetical protein